MVFSLLVGLVVGFGMSIPPGPISVAVIRQGIKGNFRDGLQIGIGATVMDVLYAVAAAFASSAIIARLQDFINGHLWLEVLFQFLCVALLLILGKKYFHATTEDLQQSRDKELAGETRAEKMGFTSPFILGLLMGIMNLANPSFLPSLFTVAGFVQAKEWVVPSVGGSTLYAIGFGVGVFLWFFLLLRIILHLRDRLPPTYFTYIFKVAGSAFFLFAIIVAFRVIFITKWENIF